MVRRQVRPRKARLRSGEMVPWKMEPWHASGMPPINRRRCQGQHPCPPEIPGTTPVASFYIDENGQTVSADIGRLTPVFPRSLRVDGERVHRACQFRRQRRVNHTVALDPALPLEGGRHNINPEMRLAARLVAGMALMQM